MSSTGAKVEGTPWKRDAPKMGRVVPVDSATRRWNGVGCSCAMPAVDSRRRLRVAASSACGAVVPGAAVGVGVWLFWFWFWFWVLGCRSACVCRARWRGDLRLDGDGAGVGGRGGAGAGRAGGRLRGTGRGGQEKLASRGVAKEARADPAGRTEQLSCSGKQGIPVLPHALQSKRRVAAGGKSGTFG